MTASSQTHGFPEGYFLIRSVATGRLWDVAYDLIEDGSEIILFTEKETSLVDNRRNPGADNQVFFVDTAGNLCSRRSGHALDIEGDKLVLRHRRPVTQPYPNRYSHPLPTFSFTQRTGEISVNFSHDPTFRGNGNWRNANFVLTAIPLRKPRTVIDDASQFITSAFTDPLSLFSGQSKATPDEVFGTDIDLHEDELLDEERDEAGEIDDSPEGGRKLRMIAVPKYGNENVQMHEKTKARRQWQILPLLNSDRRTGSV